jgi:penicillin amidase
VVVAGSNSHVAWGCTNTRGDWVDIVLVEPDPDDPQKYLTPDGPRRFEKELETIRVRGQDSETLEVESTIWGPLIAPDHQGRRRALRWIAHDPEAVNQGMLGLEHARTVNQAMEVANRSGIPPQNFVCADREGHIGWTVMGKIPLRTGFDGKLPVSWADGSRRWSGWLSPEDYPRLVDPASQIIWTANARVVEGEALRRIGNGGHALGARPKQIRDGLRELEKATEKDLLAVQLDDRAIFLERWRKLAVELLGATSQGRPQRQEFRRLVEESWTGRASLDSVAYRLVRAFRLTVFEKAYGALTARCREVEPRFRIQTIAQWEGLSGSWSARNRPTCSIPVILPGRSCCWPRWIELSPTWCRREAARRANLGRAQHGRRPAPSLSVHPGARPIPRHAPARTPGRYRHAPRSGVRTGASERFVVSPGREAEGIFHMPAGRSGHPLSPY